MMMMQPECITWVGHWPIQPKLWPVWQSTDKLTDRQLFSTPWLWLGKVKSANNPKLVLQSLPHPPKVKTDKNEPRPPNPPNVKLSKIGNFKTYTSSQSGNILNQFFQDNIPCQHDNYPKSVKTTTSSKSRKYPKSVLSKPPQLPKVEIVKYQFFQDHHILHIWKLLKMSLFNTPNPPKVKTRQNQSLQDYYILPKWKL